jgi:hypothetical protein
MLPGAEGDLPEIRSVTITANAITIAFGLLGNPVVNIATACGLARGANLVVKSAVATRLVDRTSAPEVMDTAVQARISRQMTPTEST